MAQDVLEEDLQGDGCSLEVEAAAQGGEAVVVGKARAERGPGTEWIVAVRGSALTTAG